VDRVEIKLKVAPMTKALTLGARLQPSTWALG